MNNEELKVKNENILLQVRRSQTVIPDLIEGTEKAVTFQYSLHQA